MKTRDYTLVVSRRSSREPHEWERETLRAMLARLERSE
jgi:hypothetical protein